MIKITNTQVITLDGHGESVLNIQQLSSNTSSKISGTFQEVDQDANNEVSYELKNEKLYETFKSGQQFISNEWHRRSPSTRLDVTL